MRIEKANLRQIEREIDSGEIWGPYGRMDLADGLDRIERGEGYIEIYDTGCNTAGGVYLDRSVRFEQEVER